MCGTSETQPRKQRAPRTGRPTPRTRGRPRGHPAQRPQGACRTAASGQMRVVPHWGRFLYHAVHRVPTPLCRTRPVSADGKSAPEPGRDLCPHPACRPAPPGKVPSRQWQGDACLATPQKGGPAALQLTPDPGEGSAREPDTKTACRVTECTPVRRDGGGRGGCQREAVGGVSAGVPGWGGLSAGETLWDCQWRWGQTPACSANGELAP